MTAEDVRTLVLGEIGNNWGRSNAHGVNLRECLLPTPQVRTYADLGGSGSQIPTRLWLILEEHPVEHSGYEVVFDEAQQAFGLATQSNEGPVFLGIYGTFLETLEAM